MDWYLIEININYSWGPQLHTLLIIFTSPPQTSFLLYKWRFEGVSFTRSCFHDEEDGSPGLTHILQCQSPVVLETKPHSLTDLFKL